MGELAPMSKENPGDNKGYGSYQCDECGAYFETKAGVSRHKGNGHKEYHDKEKLKKLYWDEDMTQREMGEYFGCDYGLIHSLLKKYRIDTKSKSVASGGYDFNKSELVKLYKEKELSTVEIADRYDVDSSTVSRQLQKHNITTRGFCKGKGWDGGRYWNYGENWREKRKRAKERDGHKCQICGMPSKKHNEKYGRALEVHHITPRIEFYSDGEFDAVNANKLDNLMTVCKKCHSKWEGIPLKPQ